MATSSLAEASSHPITRETFLEHDQDVRAAKSEAHDASAALARAKKAAKGGSVNLTAYKIMETIRRMEPEERPIVVRDLMQYCAWCEMPIGAQASLIDAPKVVPIKAPRAARKPSAAERAANQQLNAMAGLNGDTPSH